MAEINELIPQAELEALSRRNRKKQETRWRIFNAAMALMRKRGFDAVTIEDICEAADVSNPLFFHHFSNKAALIRTYLDCLQAEITQKLATAAGASSSEKLDMINREVIKTSKNSVAFTPQLLAEMFRGENRLDIEHVDTGMTGALARIIAEGQEAGEFSKNWHPDVVALTLVGAWLVLPLAAKGRGFPKNSYDVVLGLIKSGLQH
jgi:AcrR family transcriptional regulator